MFVIAFQMALLLAVCTSAWNAIAVRAVNAFEGAGTPLSDAAATAEGGAGGVSTKPRTIKAADLETLFRSFMALNGIAPCSCAGVLDGATIQFDSLFAPSACGLDSDDMKSRNEGNQKGREKSQKSPKYKLQRSTQLQAQKPSSAPFARHPFWSSVFEIWNFFGAWDWGAWCFTQRRHKR